MERYQVNIAYDGTDFQGFQRQGNRRTVQKALEDALRQLSWQGRAILYAGRTDTGVHAAGQVIAFDLQWEHTPEELGQALNANLPEDVAVCEVRVANSDFHPRYDAVARKYEYRLFCQAKRDPLRDRYAGRIWPEVRADLLYASAKAIEGVHDFTAFGSPLKPGGSTIRVVYTAGWRKTGDEWTFEVTANAFLYRMVRRLVFVQVQVAQQRLTLEKLVAALENPVPLIPGLAKPNGLKLERVYYAEDRLEPEGFKQPLSASGEEDCG
jgi:tRNA pseudouridine38-40 synthase